MTIKDEAAKKKNRGKDRRPGITRKSIWDKKKALGSVKGTLDLVSKSTLDRRDVCATILEQRWSD